MTLRSIFDNVRTYVVIAFGLLVLSIAWTAFLLPHQITTRMRRRITINSGTRCKYSLLYSELILRGLHKPYH